MELVIFALAVGVVVGRSVIAFHRLKDRVEALEERVGQPVTLP